MTLPEMIIFDYGHTLIYEPYFNEERGTEAVLKYAVRNANNLSAKEVCAYQNKLFLDISKKSRSIGLEIHNQKFQNLLYDYLDINIPLAPVEIEHIFWDNAAPGIIMQNADKMLDYINKKGIRSSVISNISFSGEALAERINRLFPDNRFEFIIASSEYVYRKPNPVLFELAVKKARLSPDKVWFCGDSTVTDVSGASAAGIFPVWYQSRLECIYRDKSEDVKPECEHMHIRDWEELTDILEKL